MPTSATSSRSIPTKGLVLLAIALGAAAGCGGGAAETSGAHEPAAPSTSPAEAAASAANTGTPAGGDTSGKQPGAEAAKADSAPGEGAGVPAIPEQCAEGQADGVCAPSAGFVKWLCSGYSKPDIALILFAKDSPWTRVYLNRNVEAWYTSGPESTKAKLMFDEEVIVVHHVKNSGGMVVNEGVSEYDVLRWDGVCASLGSEEITRKHPPAAKRASIPWQMLERNVRDALDQDPEILKAEIARKKECKGTTTLGMMSASCVKADDKLSAAIADYVSRGGKSPLPKRSH
jgi:hypothetical protein